MPFSAEPVQLTDDEHSELRQMSLSRSLPSDDVFRARLILMLADGRSYAEIQQRLDTTAPTISRWRKRFIEDRVAGLMGERHPGQKPSVITPALQAKVLEATRRKPKDGSTHWSCRKLAKQLGLSKDTVHRIWRIAGLRPHRLDRYMASNDPDFEKKAADIIGLYLNPPQHAAVFCIDEKTAIQALDRLDPVLPMSPGRAERHGFEYFRHGTLSLYAALDVKSGKVHGKTAARHTSEEFVSFLEEVAGPCRKNQEIHIVLDNLSAHKTKKVAEFLDQHPNVKLHFTSDVLIVAESGGDLVRTNRARCDRPWSLHVGQGPGADSARPIRWKYSDVARRITC
ncbi:MAG TPA: IS630 family transposase [Nitrospiraceae bacterium]|nr:IS630 family transposase [Nitrospiraceae bacterium]